MQRIRAATASIVLVADNAQLIVDIVSLLADDATSVCVHGSFDRFLDALSATAPPDVVILDDSFDHDASLHIRMLRQRMPSVLVAYVNARDDARMISLLDVGADDAMVVASAAVAARLQSLARRARTVNAGARIAVGDIVFDREGRRVWCAGNEVVLTPHEFGVVDCLFWHAPKAVDVDAIVEFVWGTHAADTRRTLVQVYMSYVRKKLAASSRVGIRYVVGLGYGFAPKVRTTGGRLRYSSATGRPDPPLRSG